MALAQHKREGPEQMLSFLHAVVFDTIEVPAQRKGQPPEEVPKHETRDRMTAAKVYLEYTLPRPVAETAELQDSVRELVDAIRAKDPPA